MAAIVGIGGVFPRVRDPQALYAWYEQHFGLKREHGCFVFPAAQARASTLLAFFDRESSYFPVSQPVLLNLQVEDLDAVLARLEAEGTAVDPRRETYPQGRFGWFTDPEGNRVELWQPAAGE